MNSDRSSPSIRDLGPLFAGLAALIVIVLGVLARSASAGPQLTRILQLLLLLLTATLIGLVAFGVLKSTGKITVGTARLGGAAAFIVVVFLRGIGFLGSSAEIDLVGTVLAGQDPIAGANVSVDGAPADPSPASTNSEGRFSITVTPREGTKAITLRVRVPNGKTSVSKEVPLGSNGYIDVKIQFDPKTAEIIETKIISVEVTNSVFVLQFGRFQSELLAREERDNLRLNGVETRISKQRERMDYVLLSKKQYSFEDAKSEQARLKRDSSLVTSIEPIHSAAKRE